MIRRLMTTLTTGLMTCLGASGAHAQSIGPEFAADYVLTDLGSVATVPVPYGAVGFMPGDPNTLLIGGHANSITATLYAVTVTRDSSGSISGFACAEPVEIAAVHGNSGGIDGGLDFGPGNVLFYTTYNDNRLGQILPGSTAPDRLIELTPLGVTASTGTLRFVPPGFAGAGRLKIASYNAGRFYDATISPADDGTFDVTVSRGFVQLSGGPEGIVYIAAGNPEFTSDSMLISLYAEGTVRAFEIDDDGDPIPETSRVFVSGLSGAEGAAIDPLTGDFIFSTFGGGSRVVRVTGFTEIEPCRSDLNGDLVVDGADLGAILGAWGSTGGGFGDVSGDCVVDGEDLGLLLGEWGQCAGG